MPPLSILIWLPAVCGLLGALIPGGTQTARKWGLPGLLALAGTIVALGLAIAYIVQYGPGSHGLKDVTDIVWIAELGIHYKLGVSGLNVLLVGLTTLLFFAAVLALNLRSTTKDKGDAATGAGPIDRPRLFYFQFMLAESAVLGAFLAQDLALFVAFFDLMLIPFYFLIGMWGEGPDRVKATIKLVIYTLVGSLLMLAAAIATGVLAGEQNGGHITFVLSQLQGLPLSKGSQEWIFLFFAAAFLVKMPAFPLHGWMPDGYRAMPIEVLMVFSGVLSKVGAYGFLAIVLPLFPQGAAHFQTLMLIIALCSIIYGSAVAFTQTDARLIAGYSSVAQLGFITLGIFALNPQGAQGALLADGQSRSRGRADLLHHRAACAAHRRLAGHPPNGRHRLPRAGAGHDLPGGCARYAGNAWLGQLRRRVPDPAGRLQSQARDCRDRVQRCCDGQRLCPTGVHSRDAQSRRQGREIA